MWLRDASHWRRTRQMNALAGLTFVSQAVLAEFERDWPEVTIPRRVVANGFDTAAWRPQPTRERTVLAVGRVTPEKGLLEAAQRAGRHPAAPPRLDRDFRRFRTRRLPRLFRRDGRGAGAARTAGAPVRRPAVRRGQGSQRTGGDRASRRRCGANRSAAPASRRTPAAPRSSRRAAAACARSAATRRCISPPSSRRESPRRWRR